MKRTTHYSVLSGIMLLVLAPMSFAPAADWPTFRGDNRRSGAVKETLATPLKQAWVFQSRFAPRPSFGHGMRYGSNGFGGRVERRRIDFDRVDSAVAAAGRVFFGSVGDGRIYCLEAETGLIRWTFATGGPVRLAPTVWDGRVYAGSDDGWVYCLKAEDGAVVWQFHAAPSDLQVVGNGRLISLWPVRTGVLVEDGVAYFAAGIFPDEGMFVYALDARTGNLLWKNDKEGDLPMGQMVPLGYLLATSDRLFMPRGRIAPAVFDRRTGDLRERLAIHTGGGSFAMIDGSDLFAGWEQTWVMPIGVTLPPGTLYGYNTAGGLPCGGQIVLGEGVIYSCGVGTEQTVDVSDVLKAYTLPAPQQTGAGESLLWRRTIPPKLDEVWSRDLPGVESVIRAGEVVVAGAQDAVAVFRASNGEEIWRASVDGSALSLAVADGRLYVSTDKGKQYCFATSGGASPVSQDPKADAVEASPAARKAVDMILRSAPETRKGFALVYGVEDGELAMELARRTDLMIYGVSPDAKKVEAARQRLDRAGLLGGRVTVRQCELKDVPYTKYFANLVVSETALVTGEFPGVASEVHRMTAPIRGMAVLGAPGGGEAMAEAFGRWSAGTPLADVVPGREGGVWAVYRRPPLEGAKPWTHPHATPGASNSSEDREVRRPLRVQWFGMPGPTDGPNRHKCASPPVAFEGRMFFCSERDVSAYDAYNGTELWRIPLENAWRADVFALGGNAVVGPEGYFVARSNSCYRIDPATGRTLAEYKTPPPADGSNRMWGCVILCDGVLIGSRTTGTAPLEREKWTHTSVAGYWKEAQRSDLLFAMDPATGKVLWQYVPPDWFYHANVVVGDGMVFLAQMGVTPQEEQQALDEIQPFVQRLNGPARDIVAKNLQDRFVAQLLALDLKTGRTKWKRPVDWASCGGGKVPGAMRPPDWQPGLLMVANGVLVQSPVSGHKGGVFPEGLYPQNCAAAREAATGKLLWLASISNGGRPLIIDNTIYGEPWAFDLKTGAQNMVDHPVTGQKVPRVFQRPYKHCGITSASAYIIAGRSEGMGFYDILRDEGTAHLSAKRANCWVSSIFADGVALWPVGGSGCQCALPIQCSVALVHDETPRRFAVYCRTGGITPVKHLAVNLGATGDMRDGAGRLWLAFPRPAVPYFGTQGTEAGIALPLEAAFIGGTNYQRRAAFWNPIDNTDTPWVYTSAAHGLKALKVPARAAADGPADYTVRLHFAAPPGDKPGQRVFDVKIQGQVARRKLDIVKEAGKPDTALVLEFKGIRVVDDLTIELVPSGKSVDSTSCPILSGVAMETT